MPLWTDTSVPLPGSHTSYTLLQTAKTPTKNQAYMNIDAELLHGYECSHKLSCELIYSGKVSLERTS